MRESTTHRPTLEPTPSTTKLATMDQHTLETTQSTNVIPDFSSLSLSDYQQLKLTEAYNKLIENTQNINKDRETKKYDKRVYNLSFKSISENFFTTWTHIINEMTDLIHDKDNNKEIRNYYNILVKGDRIIYVGILLVLLSLFLFFIFMTK